MEDLVVRGRCRRTTPPVIGLSIMAMVCPQCNGAYDQQLSCPKCSTRLDYQIPRGRKESSDWEAPSQWQQTPWGRIVVGLLLAQGLYYGLRQLFTAGLLVTGDEAAPDV